MGQREPGRIVVDVGNSTAAVVSSVVDGTIEARCPMTAVSVATDAN